MTVLPHVCVRNTYGAFGVFFPKVEAFFVGKWKRKIRRKWLDGVYMIVLTKTRNNSRKDASAKFVPVVNGTNEYYNY